MSQADTSFTQTAGREKIDFKKRDKFLYKASDAKLTLLDVPPMQFLTVNGFGGNPAESELFQAGIEQLYAYAYTLKFMFKAIDDPHIYDFVVPPLECLWWNPDDNPDNNNPAKMHWQLMVRQAEFVNQTFVDDATTRLRDKGKLNEKLPISLSSYSEGRAAQLLHVGPYNRENETIARLKQLAEAEGLKLGPKHHEMYISDPRRVAPEKLRTIIRYPISQG